MTRTGPAPEGPKVEWSATVDVKAVLSGLAKSKKQKLNYDKSIVDLLKLLDSTAVLPLDRNLPRNLAIRGTQRAHRK